MDDIDKQVELGIERGKDLKKDIGRPRVTIEAVITRVSGLPDRHSFDAMADDPEAVKDMLLKAQAWVVAQVALDQ